MAAVINNANPIANAHRILFKTIPAGDWRKFTGTSNDFPEEGGGARDLRFNGISHFDAIAATLLTTPQQVTRRREGVPTPVTIHTGQLRYGSAPHQVANATFEPPTSARHREWRLTQVAGMEPMASAQPVAQAGDEDLLVLAQQPSGEVWAIFSTVNNVAAGQFTQFIQSVAKHASRDPERAAVGFFDVPNNQSRHNQ
jgi:hypothetical protein